MYYRFTLMPFFIAVHMNENEALLRMEQMTDDVLSGEVAPPDLSSLDPVYYQFSNNSKLLEMAVRNTVLLVHKGALASGKTVGLMLECLGHLLLLLKGSSTDLDVLDGLLQALLRVALVQKDLVAPIALTQVKITKHLLVLLCCYPGFLWLRTFFANTQSNLKKIFSNFSHKLKVPEYFP